MSKVLPFLSKKFYRTFAKSCKFSVLFRVKFTVYAEGSPHIKHTVEGYEGDNLLDTLNDMSI